MKGTYHLSLQFGWSGIHDPALKKRVEDLLLFRLDLPVASSSSGMLLTAATNAPRKLFARIVEALTPPLRRALTRACFEKRGRPGLTPRRIPRTT